MGRTRTDTLIAELMTALKASKGPVIKLKIAQEIRALMATQHRRGNPNLPAPKKQKTDRDLGLI